jgi:hypothetical protein
VHVVVAVNAGFHNDSLFSSCSIFLRSALLFSSSSCISLSLSLAVDGGGGGGGGGTTADGSSEVMNMI